MKYLDTSNSESLGINIFLTSFDKLSLFEPIPFDRPCITSMQFLTLNDALFTDSRFVDFESFIKFTPFLVMNNSNLCSTEGSEDKKSITSFLAILNLLQILINIDTKSSK